MRTKNGNKKNLNENQFIFVYKYTQVKWSGSKASG